MKPEALPSVSAEADRPVGVVASAPLGENQDAGYTTVAAATAAEQVGRDVQRTECPAPHDGLQAALRVRAEAQVTAGAELPLDGVNSVSDHLALEAIDAAKEKIAEAEGRTLVTAAARTEARLACAPLMLPTTWRGWLKTVLPLLLATVLGVVCLGWVMASSIDAFVFRAYYLDLYGDGGALVSSKVSLMVGVLCAAATLVPQAAATIVSRGRLPWLAKLGFVAVDLLFAGGFAMTRMTAGRMSWSSVALSVFELSILFCFTLLVIVTGRVLADDAHNADVYAVASGRVAHAEAQHQEALYALSEADRRFVQQVAVVAAREQGARRLEARKHLAATTADAEYQIAVAGLAAAAAKNPAEAELDRQIGTQEAAEANRWLAARERGRIS